MFWTVEVTLSLTVLVRLGKEMLLMVAVPSYFFKVYSMSVGMVGGSLSQIISEKIRLASTGKMRTN